MNIRFTLIVLVIGIYEVYSESSKVYSIQRALAMQVLKSTLNSTKNTIVSVLPLQLSLCKLASVAKGEAKKELLKAVGLTNDTMVNSYYSKLRSMFEQQTRLDLTYLNKIYINYTDDINDSFLANSYRQYGVSVDKVSYNYPKSAVAFINKKVSLATYRRVEDVVQAADIDRFTKMLLVTAVHYKPTWETAFNYSVTKSQIFRHLGNKVSNTPMMSRVGMFYYYDAKDYQALGITMIGMFMLLIKPTFITLERFLDKLQADPDLLQHIIPEMKEKEIKLIMPRMKIRSQHELSGYLNQIGIKEILNSSSTGLNSIMKHGVNTTNIFINKVKQKLVLEVDEFGVYRNRYLRNQDNPSLTPIGEFILDQPFYFTVNMALTNFDPDAESKASRPYTSVFELLNGVFYGPE